MELNLNDLSLLSQVAREKGKGMVLPPGYREAARRLKGKRLVSYVCGSPDHIKIAQPGEVLVEMMVKMLEHSHREFTISVKKEKS